MKNFNGQMLLKEILGFWWLKNIQWSEGNVFGVRKLETQAATRKTESFSQFLQENTT